MQELAARVAKTEEKQALLADQHDQILHAQAQPSMGWQQSQDQVLNHNFCFAVMGFMQQSLPLTAVGLVARHPP